MPAATVPYPVQREIHNVGLHTREWVIDGHDIPPLRDRQITFLGVSEAREGFSFGTRGWPCGQIMVCLSGRGRVKVGDRWHTCGAGDAYLTPAMVPHAYNAVRGVPWVVAWVTFNPPHQKTPLADLRQATLVKADPQPLYHLLMGLYYEQLTRRDLVLLEGWAESIEQLLHRFSPSLSDAGRLWPVWHAVDANPAGPWSVDLLGEVIGMSGEHLRRLCIKHLGRTPMAQVTLMRMRRAATLLRSSQLKVDLIAEQLGYADRFSFAVAFKRLYRISPAAFRNARGAGAGLSPAKSSATPAL